MTTTTTTGTKENNMTNFTHNLKPGTGAAGLVICKCQSTHRTLEALPHQVNAAMQSRGGGSVLPGQKVVSLTKETFDVLVCNLRLTGLNFLTD